MQIQIASKFRPLMVTSDLSMQFRLPGQFCTDEHSCYLHVFVCVCQKSLFVCLFVCLGVSTSGYIIRTRLVV